MTPIDAKSTDTALYISGIKFLWCKIGDLENLAKCKISLQDAMDYCENLR